MPKTIPITDARSKLMELPDDLARHPEEGAVTITRRGRPVLAVLSWELYESLVETLEILSDEELMKSLRKSIRQAQAGKLIPLEEVERRLGL
jgi:prevent-host-death family protein